MQTLEFSVSARDLGGNACDPLERFRFECLTSALRSAAPVVDGQIVPLEVRTSERQGKSVLVVRAEASVKAMLGLRDNVLSGEFDLAMAKKLGKDAPLSLIANRTNFAEEYEQSVLGLDDLTAHQSEKLQECDIRGDVHLKAPAGAGKTFVALHHVLDVLSRSSGVVLFVSRSLALSNFAASWIGKRVQDPERRLTFERLHFLSEPFDGVLRAVATGRRVCLRPVDLETSHLSYALVVVDEAHHVYSDPAIRAQVEAHVASTTQRFLLSDISQSLGRDIAYPEKLNEVELSEVVRCSKRIVAGAMAFQLGGEEKLLTRCHHESTGPPLKSFLFDVPVSDPDCFGAYAEHTLRALDHVLETFPGLHLHNRLAIAVPNAAFLEGFREVLSHALCERFNHRRFRLVDAATASADLGAASGKQCADKDFLHKDQHHRSVDVEGWDDDDEWLVYDTIREFDGLERLMVICVGLDSVIGAKVDGGENTNAVELETRSMLYRAVTRAHLLVLVVNEFLRGGWLEFLGSVRLRDDETFDSSAELQRSEATAVEEVVMTELSNDVLSVAKVENLDLEGQALNIITSRVAALREQGRELDDAIHLTLKKWRFSLEQSVSALRKAANKLSPAADEDEVRACQAALALSLFQSQIVKIEVSALEELQRPRNKEREARITSELRAAAASINVTCGSDLLAVLRTRVVGAMDCGETMAAAARAAVVQWQLLQAQVAAKLTSALQVMSLPEPNPDEVEKLEAAIRRAMLRGESLEEAVGGSVRKWRADVAEEELEESINATVAMVPPRCRSGSLVRLVGLGTQDFNGKEGKISHYAAEKDRWVVVVEERRRLRLAVKAENLVLLEQATEEIKGVSSGGMAGLKKMVREVLASVRTADGHEAQRVSRDEAIDSVVSCWFTLEPKVASALEFSAEERQLCPGADTLKSLTHDVVQRLCSQELQLSPGDPELVVAPVELEIEDAAVTTDFHSVSSGDSTSDDDATSHGVHRLQGAVDVVPPNLPSRSLADAVHEALSEWNRREREGHVDAAEIAAALEAAAHAQRLLLTDAAAASLQQSVALARRRGDSLADAVDAAVRGWHRQLVRRQVQQTVWDPSGNLTRKVTGLVRFMPFKNSAADQFQFCLLVGVFSMLEFNKLGDLERVSKLWRGVANDPSWKPNLIAYAWGAADVTGLSRACATPKMLVLSMRKEIVHIACSDESTLALTQSGDVWAWGASWLGGEGNAEPTQLHELRDVVSLTCTPAGYFHGRSRRVGFSCAAITRDGTLYTWGRNSARQLLIQQSQVSRPTRVSESCGLWHPRTEKALFVGLGLDFMVLCVQRATEPGARPEERQQHTSVLMFGELTMELLELRDVPLRQLVAGAFFGCALTPRGELYTFGDKFGTDLSNGNLLGQGEEDAACRMLTEEGMGPVAEVACSTYSTIAITVDGRVFSWGDCDGGALGHHEIECHTPHWIAALRWLKVTHGSLSYTNGAVATTEGRVFVWGGNAWQGGIAEGRATKLPTEVRWSGVPACYRCSSVSLAHRHGYLIFRKQP